ncbi:hypothetical protein GTU79_21980 [Sodalis ligni]|uniref:hypothetical protein n=1 Tax=Sodalis ligni TaxID=2697027 RepID=UPI001BDF5186|nr:hypothetical protein [Sodalis ligni]QWA09940.1 hypothetical protein GTU79_21980 [Sodalis ligni]
MDNNLKPCRNSVLEFDYMHETFSDKWISQRVVLASNEVIEYNRNIINEFVKNLDFSENIGHVQRTEIQKHEVCNNVSLRDIMEKVLINIRITGNTDSQRNTALLLNIKNV